MIEAAWTSVIALLVAFALDRWLGEPPARLHPVVWMGNYLGWFGARIAPRVDMPSPDWRAFWAGALAWFGGAAVVFLSATVLQSLALTMDEALAGCVLGVLLKPLMSWRMLRDEVLAVEDALGQSLFAGQQRLGHLVSREVMKLSPGEVRESAIESLAENFNDSVVAPVFWFVVAGLPGAAIYRFANTADAMWGYPGMRAGSNWQWAGKWAARADDLLSWVPARITALLFAAVIGGLSWSRLRREAARTPSPNSGWPMAAMAIALGTQLRKPGVYALNAQGTACDSRHTAQAIDIATRAIALLLLLSVAAIFAIAGERPW